jgi:uncharacterized protein DUF6680
LDFPNAHGTRAIRAGSDDHVRALNLIELYFDGKSLQEKEVRDAWEEYLDFLYQRCSLTATEAEAKAYNDKGVDFLIALLEAMGTTLGYNFNKAQLRHGGYYPQGHADDANSRALIRDGLVRVLRDGQPVPMSVVSFPVSEEAMQTQKLVQDALLQTLSGDKPLRIKTEIQ